MALLKNCPFCRSGRARVAFESDQDRRLAFFVICDACRAQGPPVDEETGTEKPGFLETAAKVAWNRRPREPEP